MKQCNLFVWGLILVVGLLSACGDGDVSDGAEEEEETPIATPWDGIDSGALGDLGEQNPELVRVLDFNDGLTIVYDGSSPNGDEKVCRRELVDGDYLEVCMPLLDDPYFIAPEINAWVWHPLMFERFSSELTCYKYAPQTPKRSEDCVAEVFYRWKDGEDFFCEAGVFNGDKALKCSDDWAVVVNGEDDDTKTVCRVHLTHGSGRCLGAPKNLNVVDGNGIRTKVRVPDEELILAMPRTTWEGYRSHQDNPKQFAVGESVSAGTPQDIPPGAVLEYVSLNPAICTVDNDDSDGGVGTVTIAEDATPPANCRILLNVEAAGFVERVLFAELPILANNDATWANYRRDDNYFYPRETLAAEAVVSSEPSATENTYTSLDPSICTVDNSGTVTALAAGECIIRLVARAEGYLDVMIEKNFPVDPVGPLTGIVWSDFPTSAVVGVTTAALADPVVQDGEGSVSGATIAINVISGDCSYNADKTLSFTDESECVVEVSASGVRGYADYEKQFRVTPQSGSFTLAWDGYANSNGATFGAAAPALVPPATSNPVLSDVSYRYSATGNGCTVDPDTGALTIERAGTCAVTVSASRSGYSDQMDTETITVAKAAQALLVSPASPYGGLSALKNGESVEILAEATGGHGGVEYQKTGSCSVDSDGAVTANAASGTCLVQARWRGDENYEASTSYTDLVTLTMVSGASSAPTWGSNPYDNNPTVGGVEPLATAPTGSGTGNIGYRSANDKQCRVVGATGAVIGVAAGDCTVQARYTGDSSTGPSGWVDFSLTVDKGTPTLPTDPYGGSPEVAVDGSLALTAAGEEYMDVLGTATYSVKSGSETYCEVESATGTVTGLAVGPCVIAVTLESNENYEALAVAADFATLTLVLGEQTVVAGDTYGLAPSLVVGGELTVVRGPVSVAGVFGGGTVTYRDSDGGNVCTVDGSGTVTGVAVGECTVQAMAQALPPNYAASDWVDIATITVGKGMFAQDDIEWEPEIGGGDDYEPPRVNAETRLQEVNDYTGATITYSVVNAGETGCAFKGSSGRDARTLTFSAPGVCVVKATARLDGYHDWNQEHSIRVKPRKITVGTNPGFDSSARLTVGSETAVTPGVPSDVNPSDANVYWRLARGERDCTLNNRKTGAVIARQASFAGGTPECSLQLMAEKRNHETFRSALISVPLAAGTLPQAKAPVFGDRASGTPSNTLLLNGGALEMIVPPLLAAGATIYPDIVLEIEGFDVSGTNLCAIDDDGRVTVGTAATAGDTCTITARMTSLGYGITNAAPVSLTIVENVLSFSDDPLLEYPDGGLKFAQSGPLNKAGSSFFPPRDDNEVEVVWHYSVQGVGQDGEFKDRVCSVMDHDDTHPGQLTLGRDALPGDVCRIYLTAKKSGYGDYAATPIDMEIGKGELAFESAAKPNYTGQSLRIGGRALPAMPSPVEDDNSVAVIWREWQAQGADGDDNAKADVCTVNPHTGVVSAGSAAVAGDSCTISARARATHYSDTERMDIGVLTVIEMTTLTSVVGPVYNGYLILRGDALPFAQAPTINPAERGAVWSYQATGKRGDDEMDDICSVHPDTGAVSPGPSAQGGDTCEIVASVAVPGYEVASAAARVLSFKRIFSSLAWSDFPSSAVVGTDTAALGAPVSDPATTPTIAKVSGDCSYDTSSKKISFTDTTACIFKVTATKEGYVDIVATYSVTPAAGTIDVTSWGTYGAVTVGNETAAAAITVANSLTVDKAYALASNSAGLYDDQCWGGDGNGVGDE